MPMWGKHIDAKPKKLPSTLPGSFLKLPIDSLDEHLKTKVVEKVVQLNRSPF